MISPLTCGVVISAVSDWVCCDVIEVVPCRCLFDFGGSGTSRYMAVSVRYLWGEFVRLALYGR